MKLFKEYANITATSNPETIQIRFGENNLMTGTAVLDDAAIVLPTKTAVEMAHLIIDAAQRAEKIKADAEVGVVPTQPTVRLQ